MKRISLILVLFFVCVGLSAQTHTHVYNEQIRTLRVERRWLVLEDGVVDGTDPENTLHISFDEMSHDTHMYSYEVRMINERLQAVEVRGDRLEVNAGMLSSEYLKGFTTKDITEYEHSINTSREYTHYWFDFPNEDMQLTKSGAYLLTIYEDGNPDNKVAEVIFYVVEPMVKIDARVRANTDIEFNGRYQQIDVDVDLQQSGISYQPSELRIVVTQNNRMDNAVYLSQPTFIEPNRLRYVNNKSLIFEGGNEYHHFDAFSCFYAGHGIDRVFHENGDYHVLLFPNEVTEGQYIHEFDSNGRYVVNAERTNDADTEAEYMWVHWTLPVDKPWLDGSLYVGGELFNNEMGMRNRMQYDADARCYWLTALVKQGGYDYQYVFVPKTGERLEVRGDWNTTTQRVDGSYWQTENEYTIYVWWRPFGSRSERLVGVSMIK